VRPRRLIPSFRDKIWGATRLEPWFPNSKEKIGEVWFQGEDAPLLVKFLFTSENLSVQVHPRGKTEMWHILAAAPGAKIAAGFREKVTEEQLRDSALSGEIETLLAWHDAAPGDTFFIPAGTVHAIGGGLTLCEIQQNSDVTYRLYDYGRGRELHLDQALAVSDLGPYAARQEPRGEVLVSCEHFVTKRIRVEGTRLYRPPAHRSPWLIAIEGSGWLGVEPVKAGEVWQVPRDSPAFDLTGGLTLLETRPADFPTAGPDV
jgi:mannose-6-phosphate isomerase